MSGDELAAFDALPPAVRARIAADKNQLVPSFFVEHLTKLKRENPRRREKWLTARLLEEVEAVSDLAHEHHERVMREALGQEVDIVSLIPG
jgi:hypothetical protein